MPRGVGSQHRGAGVAAALARVEDQDHHPGAGRGHRLGRAEGDPAGAEGQVVQGTFVAVEVEVGAGPLVQGGGDGVGEDFLLDLLERLVVRVGRERAAPLVEEAVGSRQ